MEMRRKDRKLNEQTAISLLEHCEYAVLSTVNEDGSPYGIPISPVLEGNNLYFHCALEGRKLRNIRNHPAVCVVCVGETRLVPEKFTTEYQSAVAFGIASMVEDEKEKIRILYLLCQKYAASNLGAFEQEVKRSLSRTGICKIEITEWSAKGKRVNSSF